MKTLNIWLVALAAMVALAAAHCGRNVPLGVDPSSDAAGAPADGGAGD
jgi:predicted small lipoprotein YifL